jgi:phage terminase small subunit
MLTGKQSRFAFEYPKDSNATKAAERAGYSERTAYSIGSELLKKPEILEAIEVAKERAAAVSEVSVGLILREWLDILSADPNDLVTIHRDSCRDCYDADTRELMKASGMRESLRVPNPDCETCKGLGVEDVIVADMRNVKGPARKLYAGAVRTKDGVKVLMRDRDAAAVNLARFLGMLVDKRELSGPGGGPIPLEAVQADDLSDEQLMAIASSSPLLLEGER